ncbi:hypothetical protein Landi51_13829 [Colletotrichum acutatum]
MSCLCTRLQSKDYDSVTVNERSILLRTYQEARHLFEQTTSEATPQPKRKPSHKALPPAKRGCPRFEKTISEPTLPIKKGPSRKAIRRYHSLRGPGSAASVIAADACPSSPSANTLVSNLPHCNSTSPSSSVSEGPLLLNNAPNLTTEGTSTLVDRLEKTILDKALPIVLSQNEVSAVPARLYLACDTGTLQGRLASYELARRHHRGTSLDDLIKIIQEYQPQPEDALRKQVSKRLHRGRAWTEVFDILAEQGDKPAEDYIGLLAHISSPTVWEKAETAALRQALLSLQKKRDIRQMAHCATPAAREFIDSLTLTRTFIDDTPRHSQSFRATAPAPKASVNDKTNPAILPRPSFPSQSSHDFLCDDTDKLLRLSYFFASSYHVPVDMLRSGTAPRCRWSKEGDVVCRQSSVHPHLVSFINDQTRLEDAIDKLTEKRYIECTTTDGLKMYRLLPNGSSKALDGLDQESASYWKRQALLVSYHAIPWKYLEPSTPISVMATPHLQHVLGNDESLHCFDLSAEVREDLILTLVEAVRLPKIPWKVFAVERAVALCGIGQSAYAIARVNEVTSLVSRLAKKPILPPDVVPGPTDPHDLRVHAAAGLVAVQKCLDEMQREELPNAEKTLEQWKPQSTHPMTQVVLFRKSSLLGQIERQKGDFEAAELSLTSAFKTADEPSTGKNLHFDEDRPALACSLSDARREQLCEDAETHVRQLLEGREGTTVGARSRAQLQASLAECLFAKGHKRMGRSDTLNEALSVLYKADELCQSLLNLDPGDISRFDQLRSWLTQAKISFIKGDYIRAENGFKGALDLIAKFDMTNGYVTMVIVRSMAVTLKRSLDKSSLDSTSRSKRIELFQQSEQQWKVMKCLVHPTGTRFWMPGLQKWEEWLYSTEVLRGRL